MLSITGLIMFFKRKPKKPKLRVNQGLTRVFPEEIFEGEIGKLLKSAGIDPNSAGNILDAQSPPINLLESHKKEFNQQWAFINENLPYDVAPVNFLPEEVWHESEVGWFMISQLNLYPHRPWNTIFLPVDSAGAQQTGLPEYFAIQHQPDLKYLIGLVLEIKRSFGDHSDNLTEVATLIADDWAKKFPWLFPDDHPSYNLQQKRARKRIRSLATFCCEKTIGIQTIIKCQKLCLAQPEIQLIA